MFGVIDTSWTFKKAELLQIRAAELQVCQKRFQSVNSEQYHTTAKTSKDPLNVPKQYTKIWNYLERSCSSPLVKTINY